MGSILTWHSFWIAVGFMAPLLISCFAYRIGYAEGEDGAANEIADLYRQKKKLDREVDFLHAENDNLRRLLHDKVQAAHYGVSSIQMHLEHTARDNSALRALVDSARIRSKPTPLIKPELNPPGTFLMSRTAIMEGAPKDHFRGINSEGSMIMAGCKDPNCSWCNEHMRKSAEGQIPGLILSDKNHRE
jgi:hypothetical protein